LSLQINISETEDILTFEPYFQGQKWHKNAPSQGAFPSRYAPHIARPSHRINSFSSPFRTAGGGSSGGAGCHHGQSLEATFIHFPGLKVCFPATPEDGKGLLKAAIRDDNPVVFYEHKLLYGVKGMVADGDYTVPIGKARVAREGKDVTLVSYAWTLHKALRAAVEGIRKFPILNSQIIEDRILVKKYVHFGVVVAVQEGLLTPVLKRVEGKGVKQIARDLEEVSLRARERRLSLEDLRGGTITLSNPGVFGAVIATPIIYPPQNAILWMGRIAKQPVVREDAIVIRAMMYLCLSYDHRAIDGSIAAQFLQHVRRFLEEPRPMLEGG
jgi:hypothetical protein